MLRRNLRLSDGVNALSSEELSVAQQVVRRAIHHDSPGVGPGGNSSRRARVPVGSYSIAFVPSAPRRTASPTSGQRRRRVLPAAEHVLAKEVVLLRGQDLQPLGVAHVEPVGLCEILIFIETIAR